MCWPEWTAIVDGYCEDGRWLSWPRLVYRGLRTVPDTKTGTCSCSRNEHFGTARDYGRGRICDVRVLGLAAQRVPRARLARAEGRGPRGLSRRVRLLPYFGICRSRAAHALHGRRGRGRALAGARNERLAGARHGALPRPRARSLGGPVAGVLAFVCRGRGDFLR